METYSSDMPWVIFHLIGQEFAVSANNVREMVAMPKVSSVPQTQHYIRGVINLRGKVIPVIDLRLRMGMTSKLSELEDLIHLLEQREQDHKNWIDELESSVREKREFKLATDPHKCVFGKWYDTFTTDNQILVVCLKKFDEPHKKIHSIAIKVKKMEEEENFDAAYEVINNARDGELKEMIELFEEARNLLRETDREIALVLEWDGKTVAVGVDSVETVEKLSEANIDEVPEVIRTMDNEIIAGTAKRENGDKLVLILDAGKLLEKEEMQAFENVN